MSMDSGNNLNFLDIAWKRKLSSTATAVLYNSFLPGLHYEGKRTLLVSIETPFQI
jgi:hypothetical protein